MISLIVAMDKNRAIGKDNKLPWNLPADLAYFKKVTMGHTVIMGRKTFESIGKPLPGRQNVVVTRNKNYVAEGCSTIHSIEEALKYRENEEAFVIGGADIFKEFLPCTDRLFITLIDDEFEGDTYFPQIEYSKWLLISKTTGEKNEKNPYTYHFLVYEKK
ncbi:MAG: dihydrofolate reductase [Clostridia bacterium]|nr:dihydrofolate reductase [Clostridia bacterium]